MEERQDEEWRRQGEVGESSEGELGGFVAAMVEEEKRCGGGGDRGRDQPWGLMVEEGKGDAEDDESDGEEREVAESKAG
jgi:hypothetical protein